jgi:hypothetical protein
MDFKEVGFQGMDWIDVAQDKDWWWAPVYWYAVMNIRVP